MRSIKWWRFQWPWREPNQVFKVMAFLKSNIRKKRRVLKTKLVFHTNRKLYLTWNVWWLWLPSKRVARVYQHQLSFLYDFVKKYVLVSIVSFSVSILAICCLIDLFASDHMGPSNVTIHDVCCLDVSSSTYRRYVCMIGLCSFVHLSETMTAKRRRLERIVGYSRREVLSRRQYYCVNTCRPKIQFLPHKTFWQLLSTRSYVIVIIRADTSNFKNTSASMLSV